MIASLCDVRRQLTTHKNAVTLDHVSTEQELQRVALAFLVAERRRRAFQSQRAAATAAGFGDSATWRRVEKGKRVSVESVVKVLGALGLSEEEVRGWCARLELDYPAGMYKRPDPEAQARQALKVILRAAEEALGALAVIEQRRREN